MSGYSYVLTLQLPAGVVAGIAAAQSVSGSGSFTINGSLASGGVATLLPARQVLITSAGSDTGITFTITGTGANGLTQSEVVTGGSTTAVSTKDFKTVTSVTTSGSTASTVQIGTNTTGHSQPAIIDRFTNNALLNAALVVSGTVSTGLEVSLDDLAPAWDLNSTSPTWFDATNFTAKSANTLGTIQGPITMVRLKTTSGTGTATATILQSFTVN